MNENKNAMIVPAPGNYVYNTSCLRNKEAGTSFSKARRNMDFTTMSEKYKLYDGQKLSW